MNYTLKYVSLVLVSISIYGTLAANLPKRSGSSPNLSPETLRSSSTTIMDTNERKLNELMSSMKEIKDTLKTVSSYAFNNEKSIAHLLKNSEALMSHFFYKSCEDFFRRGKQLLSPYDKSKVINLLPPEGHLAKVRCEIDSSGQGWTVVLDRHSGETSFNRTYNDYEIGFGNTNREYYIGNRALHELTSAKRYMLRIELEDTKSKKGWAQYNLFRIEGPTEFYRLNIGEFDSKSTVGDGMVVHNQMKFATYDKDPTKKNCSKTFGGNGGWWYRSELKEGCYNSLASGVFNPGTSSNQDGGITYSPWPNAQKPLKKFKMLIRQSD